MNKFRVLLAIVMVVTLMFTLLAVPAFADEAVETDEVGVVEHDHDGDGIADHDVADGWTNLGMSGYIALVVAAVILVAFVVAIVLFVPRKTKQK